MKKLTAALTLVGASIGTAMAAVPEEVTQQISTSKADITTVGAAIVVLVATAMGFRWLKAQFF